MGFFYWFDKLHPKNQDRIVYLGGGLVALWIVLKIFN